MIATHNQQASKESLSLADETAKTTPDHEKALGKIKDLSPLLLPSRVITHHPKAGLNPLVDIAGYLFSVLGKLKQIKSHRHLSKLQQELIQEINLFQETAKNQGYNAEYIIVCRYILCATFDDIIADSPWGGQGQWECHSLLTAFNQDTQHQDKFFNILERAIKEPALYIDLMELIYICLSMGYKGQYRATEHNHYQLEQITNSLYKHIRAYRGTFSKTLSPPATRPAPIAKITRRHQPSLLVIFFVTACIIMTVFVSLGYLMDVMSNEAYKSITQIEKPVSHETVK